MRTLLPFLAGCIVFVMMVAVPVIYKRSRDKQIRNFHVVEEGVLYRSGQLPLHRLQQLVNKYEFRTIISLRDGTQTADEMEEQWAIAKGLNFVRIPYREFLLDADGNAPVDLSVKTFREIMDKPENYPVLVHCFAGIHRTGTMCAVYRMDYQGWTNQEAMAEMHTMGYTMLEEHQDVHAYLQKYRPRTDARPVQGTPVHRVHP